MELRRFGAHRFTVLEDRIKHHREHQQKYDHDDDHHQRMQLVDFAGDARDGRLQVHLVGGRCDRREKRQERSDENSLLCHACLVL